MKERREEVRPINKYLAMVGYGHEDGPKHPDWGKPFAAMGEACKGIADTDEACRIGLKAKLHEFFLIPDRDVKSGGHTGFIRDRTNDRGFRRVPTREAVLIHLIQPGPYRLKDLLEGKKNGGEQ